MTKDNKELEVAAMDHADNMFFERVGFYPTDSMRVDNQYIFELCAYRESFKAGAEWQKNRNTVILIGEDHED